MQNKKFESWIVFLTISVRIMSTYFVLMVCPFQMISDQYHLHKFSGLNMPGDVMLLLGISVVLIGVLIRTIIGLWVRRVAVTANLDQNVGFVVGYYFSIWALLSYLLFRQFFIKKKRDWTEGKYILLVFLIELLTLIYAALLI